MDICKGQRLLISHYRKGKFKAEAAHDFNTLTAKTIDVILEEDVEGIATHRDAGDRVSLSMDLIRRIEII